MKDHDVSALSVLTTQDCASCEELIAELRNTGLRFNILDEGEHEAGKICGRLGIHYFPRLAVAVDSGELWEAHDLQPSTLRELLSATRCDVRTGLCGVPQHAARQLGCAPFEPDAGDVAEGAVEQLAEWIEDWFTLDAIKHLIHEGAKRCCVTGNKPEKAAQLAEIVLEDAIDGRTIVELLSDADLDRLAFLFEVESAGPRDGLCGRLAHMIDERVDHLAGADGSPVPQGQTSTDREATGDGDWDPKDRSRYRDALELATHPGTPTNEAQNALHAARQIRLRYRAL